MLIIAIALFVLVIVIDIVHYGALFWFIHGIRRQEWKTPNGKLENGEYRPKTMVLLALRGEDPFLERCLVGLISQDYDNFAIRLIIDHPEDSVVSVAEKILAKHDATNVEWLVTSEHFETCSLKSNSLYHGVQNLDPSYEIIAVLDADANPHPSWLRRLVQPLADSRFDVATGQRWYIPDKTNPGSLIRYLWNAAAVVQLFLYKFAWGGSMALRRDMLTQKGILEIWKNSFSDDVPLSHRVRKLGGRIAFVPMQFMVNRETCHLKDCRPWFMRQLLCAKLYHPAWRGVIVQALLMNVPLLACLVIFVAGFFIGNRPALFWSLAAFAAYWLGVFFALPVMDHAVRRELQNRGEELAPASLWGTLKSMAMIPVTHCVYTAALIRLHFLRKVEWRGVEYEILPGGKIRLIEYKPYTKKRTPSEGKQSI